MAYGLIRLKSRAALGFLGLIQTTSTTICICNTPCIRLLPKHATTQWDSTEW